MKTKTFALGLFALFAFIVVATSASAYYPNSPYSGVNTIGTVWAQQYNYGGYGHGGYGGYGYGRNLFSGYIAPPRAGGFYGDTTAFITGLRAPVYAPVPPVYYTNYYQQVCSWPYCATRGAGFPRARASQFPVAGAPGGVFS